jgi:uncharacterized protein (TIGR03435 family)
LESLSRAEIMNRPRASNRRRAMILMTMHRIADERKARRMTAAGVALLTLLFAPGVVQSQSERPAFEVASVKPNNSADFRDMQLKFLPGGKVVIRNVPLLMIVATAYHVPFQSPQLTGGPEWEQAAGKRYDIEAIPEDGAIPAGLSNKAREDRIKLMLQSLLMERFKLKMRKEPKEQPVYALVVGKEGPKLQKSKLQEKECTDSPSGPLTGCHSIGGGQGRGIHGDAIGIADVVLFVQNWTDRPVVDRTGLTDLYNIQTEGWASMRQRPPRPDGAPAGGDEGLADPDRQTLPDVFRQLGLRMESQRALVDMFVVEHVERPSVN